MEWLITRPKAHVALLAASIGCVLQVNAILTEQSATVLRPAADLGSFDQGYERYSPLGLLEPQRDDSR